MAEDSTKILERSPRPLIVGRLTAVCQGVLDRIPPKARLASLVGSLVLVASAVYALSSRGTGTLVLNCRHDIRSAELAVSIDGHITYTGHFSANPKKRFILFGQTSETFSKSLTVPTGEHILQVRLSSAADGISQTKQCKFDLSSGGEGTLEIVVKKRGLSLEYAGPPGDPEKNHELNYLDSLRPVFSTILGSAVSAFIGFMVQEFLRAKKPA
jgi:hypothetical protein